MAKILDGKAISENILQEFKEQNRGMPTLAILSVGDDPASEVYVRNKIRACTEVGIATIAVHLPANVNPEIVRGLVRSCAENDAVSGIIVQLPCEIDGIAEEIPLSKDVDGFRPGTPFTPCTPMGILWLLLKTGVSLTGKHAVVVGRSEIVGKPMARLLIDHNCTVTQCHSKTVNLAAHTKQADILIVAVGRPHLITADMVKPGAIVIDVGINRVNGKLVGDVDFENVQNVAEWITPVPGGVGPMTVAALISNVLAAEEMKLHDHS